MAQELELAFWINERYAILERRRAGTKPPWTMDPIMQRVRFCNVHREDDATTMWMRKNWSNHQSPVWWFVLGRMVNYIPSLNEIVENVPPWDHDDNLPSVIDVLKSRRLAGDKVFTSAYTISTAGRSMDKVDYMLEVVQETRQCENGFLDSSLHEMHQSLTQIKGLGSFLAAQVVADMKNTKGHPLQAAPDWWEWSAPGPGSLRGLNWFFKDDYEFSITPAKYRWAADKACAMTMPYVHDYIPRIGMQDFQNCLCEFSKYMKVKHEGGHVRNTYTPR